MRRFYCRSTPPAGDITVSSLTWQDLPGLWFDIPPPPLSVPGRRAYVQLTIPDVIIGGDGDSPTLRVGIFVDGNVKHTGQVTGHFYRRYSINIAGLVDLGDKKTTIHAKWRVEREGNGAQLGKHTDKLPVFATLSAAVYEIPNEID